MIDFLLGPTFVLTALSIGNAVLIVMLIMSWFR